MLLEQQFECSSTPYGVRRKKIQPNGFFGGKRSGYLRVAEGERAQDFTPCLVLSLQCQLVFTQKPHPQEIAKPFPVASASQWQELRGRDLCSMRCTPLLPLALRHGGAPRARTC
jgi:hypothetical protein